MAIAHICLSCGQGLSRVRPRREPHYGLRIITCPRCERSCVRARLWASGAWQSLLRRAWVFGLIAIKVAVSVFLAAMTVLAATAFAMSDEDFSTGLPRGFLFVAAIAFVGLPVVTGAWLRFAFDHLDRVRLFGGWAIVIAAIILIVSALLGVGGQLEGMSYDTWTTSGIIPLATMGLRAIAPMALALLALMTIVSLAGIPLGRMAIAARRVMSRWHFRWLLKRRRLRRSQE
jgi:hypothetical protein